MKKTLSVILVIMMLVQLCCFAAAETEDDTYTVIYTDKDGVEHRLEMSGDLEFSGDGQYLISEDVDNDSGVYVSGNASVTVDGNVTGYENAVNAYEEAEVHVTGDVTGGHVDTYGDITDANGYAVYATGDATVTVDGSANSCGTGIVTMNQVYAGDEQTIPLADGGYEIHTQNVFEETTADILVKGDVKAEDDIGLNLSGKSTVTVEGNVSGYDGMFLQDDVTVDVAGNVTGTEGAGIYTANTIRSDETIDIYDENDIWAGVSPESKDEELINHVTVHVGGDVTGGFAGIEARGGSQISVDGNVSGGSNGKGAAVIAEGQVEIDVGGDVTSDGWAGIQVQPAWSAVDYELYDSEVKIHVDGNVQTTGAALDVNAAAEITVDGNVTSDQITAINIVEDGRSSTIVIGGDVNGGTEELNVPEEQLPEIEQDELQERIDALFADVDVEVIDPVSGTLNVVDDQRPEAENRSADGQIVIQGSLNAQGNNAAYTVDLYIEEDGEAELPEIPTLTVYEMNVADGDYIGLNVNEYVERTMDDSIEARILTVDPGEQKKTELVNAIAATIQYIIKVTQPEYGTIDMTGAQYDELSDQMVAHEGDDLNLTFKVNEGYYVQDVAAGTKATVSNAGNGAWIVTVQRGGGVTISANLALCKHENWKILEQKAPACTEAGSTTRQCTVCGKQETVTEKALGHQFADTFVSNNDGTHSAKCLHDGCNEVLTQDCEMETTETADTRTSVCKICQYTVTEKIEGTPAEEQKQEEQPAEEQKQEEQPAEEQKQEEQPAGKQQEPIVAGQDVVKVPVEGAAFEVVEGTENLPPLEGKLEVNVLLPDAESVFQIGSLALTGDQIVFFDIMLTHEGDAVQLDRKIRISFPVTDELIEKITGKALCIIMEDGSVVRLDYEIIDGKIVFDTDVLGATIFIDETVFMQPEETPEASAITGNNEPVPATAPMQTSTETAYLCTGTWNNSVNASGTWSQDASGIWYYSGAENSQNTRGLSVNSNTNGGQPDKFLFDENGSMLTGWQYINGKWYYLNPNRDGTFGALQRGGVTPDGWTVDESGAWIESIPQK